MILRAKIPRKSLGLGNVALDNSMPNRLFSTSKRETSTDSILEGSFYEIDQSKLPFKTPPILHSIRAVMVTAKSEQQVTIRYPSTESLEAYFGNLDHTGLRPELYPALDSKYVMGTKLAAEVLRRVITSQEFDKLRQFKYFWSIKYSRAEQLPLLVPCDSEGSEGKHGPCFPKLQCSSIKGWAIKKFVAYLPSSAESKDVAEVKSVDFRDGKETVKKKEDHGTKDLKISKDIVKKEDDHEMKDHYTKDQVISQYNRKKRKRGRPLHSKNKKSKCISVKKAIAVKSEFDAKKDAVYVDRWTFGRYESAAIQLLEILKKHGAVQGNPIPRAQLRIEARKKIGDTGLLDHLLKHLAGKVVPRDGNDRLRRRCDAEGKMEYWIESADLVSIRKEAGVNDPYWIPPPGWKLGDKIDLSYCTCRQEIKMLKEELDSMRREMAERQNEQPITVVMPDSTAASVRIRGGTLNKKETYEALMKKKILMEEQLRQISKSLMELKEQEDMEIQSNKAEAAVNQKLMSSTCQSLSVEEMNEEAEESPAGDLNNIHGEVQDKNSRDKRLILKLRPCRYLENIGNTSLSREVDHSMQDIMGLTSAPESPLSTTTLIWS